MNLRVKVLFSVIGILSLLFIIVYGILSRVLMNDYLQLEQHSVEENVARVSDAFDNEIESLSVKVSDWGQWDDTYTFVRDHNQNYIDVNLKDISLELLHIQFVIIIDKHGAILFKKQIDQSGKEVSFSEDFERYIATHPVLTEHADGQSIHSGIITLREGVIMSVARAITSGDGLSPVEGTIIFATFADDSITKKIAALTHLDVSLASFHDTSQLPLFFPASEQKMDDHTVWIGERGPGDTMVSGYSIKADMDGEKALVMRVDLDRTIYQRGQESIAFFTRIMLGGGVLIVMVILGLFEILVLRRLFFLGKAVEGVGQGTGNQSRIILPGKDEFSRLAGRINAMLVSLREMEMKKEESEKLFYAIADSAPVMIWVTDTKKQGIYFNKVWLDFTGYTLRNQMEIGWMGSLHPDDLQEQRRAFEEAFDAHEPYKCECRLRREDGVYVWVFSQSVPHYSSEGVFLGYLGSCLDITEIKQAEEKKQKYIEEIERKTNELTKFQQAVDASFDHTIITDEDGVILYANHAAEVLTGYAKEEMIGFRPSLWGRQMPRAFYETLWGTIKTEKQPYTGELTNKRKDGKLYLANIRISPIFNEVGEVKFFVGIERDITEERSVQRRIIRHADELEIANGRIEEQKDRAESILRFLKSIGEGVFATDTSGKIIFINEVAQRFSRVPASSAEGQLASQAFSFVQTMPYQSRMISLVEQALQAEETVVFPMNTISVQQTGEKIPVAGTCSLIRDMKNDIVGTIVVFRDVTQLRELDQMKNNFLSTAAHQLRTPLGSMRWSTELLINGDFGRLPKAAKEVMQQMYDSNVRMLLLVNDLLDVARIDSDTGQEEKTSVDIVALVKDIIQTMRPDAERRLVKIVCVFPKEPLPSLLLPSKHLYEALENLISNGIKYNKEGGTLSVTFQMNTDVLLLTIADTGIGIPKEDESKIFSKFFRSANAVLKETEGSGLGLSVVKSYLEESGAKISFESTENKGTTFFLEFPIHPSSEAL